MANEQDFKKLLDAQKETNKQLALLRQEQMQIAKDPPEDFLKGDEAKASALHIAADRMSGMHDTDDEIVKLKDAIEKLSGKERDKLDEVKGELGEKVTDSSAKLQGRVGDIVVDAAGNRQILTQVTKTGKGLGVFVSKTASLDEARQKVGLDTFKLLKGFQKSQKDEKKRDKEILKATKRLGFFTPERLAKKLSGDLGNTLSQVEKDNLVKNAARQREDQKERRSIFKLIGKGFGGLSSAIGGAFKGLGTAAKVATGGFFGALFGAGLLGLSSFLIRRLPLLLDKMNEIFGEDGIGKMIDNVIKFFEELFEKIGLAFNDPDGFVEGIKKQFPQLEEAFNRIKEEVDKFIEEFEGTMKTFLVAAGLTSLLLLFTPTGKLTLAIIALGAAFLALKEGAEFLTQRLSSRSDDPEVLQRRNELQNRLNRLRNIQRQADKERALPGGVSNMTKNQLRLATEEYENIQVKMLEKGSQQTRSVGDFGVKYTAVEALTGKRIDISKEVFERVDKEGYQGPSLRGQPPVTTNGVQTPAETVGQPNGQGDSNITTTTVTSVDNSDNSSTINTTVTNKNVTPLDQFYLSLAAMEN